MDLILECCEINKIKYNKKNFPSYDWYLNEYKTKDIVHFEYYDLEDVSGVEELQSGTIYLTEPIEKSQFLFRRLVGENSVFPDEILNEICDFSVNSRMYSPAFFFPLEVRGKWLIYTTINGDLKISHLSLLPRDELSVFLSDITVPMARRLELKVLATDRKSVV